MGDYFDYEDHEDDKPTVRGTTPLAERIIESEETSSILTWVHELTGFLLLTVDYNVISCFKLLLP